MNLMEVEAGRGNCDYDAVGELRELRAHFEVPYITNFYTVDRGFFSSVSDPDSIRSVDCIRIRIQEGKNDPLKRKK